MEMEKRMNNVYYQRNRSNIFDEWGTDCGRIQRSNTIENVPTFRNLKRNDTRQIEKKTTMKDLISYSFCDEEISNNKRLSRSNSKFKEVTGKITDNY